MPAGCPSNKGRRNGDDFISWTNKTPAVQCEEDDTQSHTQSWYTWKIINDGLCVCIAVFSEVFYSDCTTGIHLQLHLMSKLSPRNELKGWICDTA